MKLTRTLLALSLAGIAAPALAGIADDLKQLLADGKASDAYALVQANPDHLGEPLVDFYYGIAATDSGHASEGVLALERYVLTFPRNHAARLELARALFIAGDNERAYEEFSAVRKNSTDRAELATIDRYLDAIKVRRTRYQPSWSGYVEAGGGYDSNVNGGIDNSSLVTRFGPSTILDPALRKESTFETISARLKGSYPVAPGLILQGGLLADARYVNRWTDLNQGTLGGWGGLTWHRGDFSYSASLFHDSMALDGRRYRSQNGGNLGLAYQIDEFQSVSLTLQQADINYTQDNTPRNAQLQSATIGWKRALIHPLQPVITLQGTWGQESNQRERPDLGREYVGARAAFAVTPGARWGFGGGYTWEHSNYGGEDFLFNSIRRDEYQALDLSASYRLDRQWTLRSSVIASQNNSSIALYDYRRKVVEVALRYAF